MGAAIDAVASSAKNDATTLAWNHVMGAGVASILTVELIYRSAGVSASSVTFDGVAMELYQAVGSTVRYHEVWKLLEPHVGTLSVSASWTGAAGVIGGSISMFGVDQTDPLYGMDSVIGTGTTLQLVIPSQVDDLVIGMCQHQVAEVTAPGADETERWDRTATLAAAPTAGAGYTQPGAASVSLDPTWATSAAARLSGFAVRSVIPARKDVPFYSFPGPKSMSRRRDRNAYY